MLTIDRLRDHGQRFAVCLVAFAVAVSVGAALADELGPATQAGTLSLARAVRPAKGHDDVYIVKLRNAGAASYKGGVAGYPATKPTAGAKLDASASAVVSYVQHLEREHDALLADVGATSGKLYSFRYALNGFAARLRGDQVARLAQSSQVEHIWPDSDQHLSTNQSAIFLGLEDAREGLRAEHGLMGENVVVGVIDSGITPEHPSLLDVERHIPRACESRWARASWLGLWLCRSSRRNPPTTLQFGPVEDFRGICQTGDGFEDGACNNKVVGARYYIDGFLARHELDPNEFLSPRDADGHGTHIATIVAGNPTSAELFGTRVGRIAGIAPRARLAIYKACWLKPGERRATCATSDLARAIDDAIADGVDIINYSVGSLETDLTAPDDLALLDAFDAGILTVVAAGNDGPDYGTIGSPSSAPWVLTVAASTRDATTLEEAIEVVEPSDLAGRMAMREAGFTPRLDTRDAVEGELVLADDGVGANGSGGSGGTNTASVRDACEPLDNDLEGAIALIERGGCDFEIKLQHAEDAGAIGAIVYNTNGAPIMMVGSRGAVDIPAVMISAADGQRLANRLTADDDDDNGDVVEVRLLSGVFIERRENGNEIALFSSRGPNLSEADFLKPDVTAPGVDILGGHTPDAANGLRGERYQYLSGTSMSAPAVTGLAALLKEAYPDWSPAAIKSALTTTTRQNLVREDGEAQADPFEMGAGHVQPNLALDAGLVYDNSLLDHAAFLCGLEYSPFPANECDELLANGFSFLPSEVNLPSIGLSRMITGDGVTRRVTNVGPASTYHAQIAAPVGIGVQVLPESLTLGAGEHADFEVTLTKQGAALDSWAFGALTWTDGTREVRSPIAVQPVTMRAPEEIALSGSAGYFEFPVAYGYTGEYFAGLHGLRAPYIEQGFVAEDDTNSFSFRFDAGVTAHLIDVPPEQLYVRFALFDALTDGNDDLDLYLFRCPNNECVQVAESGGFTSEEEINLYLPEPGTYAVLVHGFDTDPAGGLGANYSLHAWSVGIDDRVGNFDVLAPDLIDDGDRVAFGLEWGGLAPATRYLGVISHNTPDGLYDLTVLKINSP